MVDDSVPVFFDHGNYEIDTGKGAVVGAILETLDGFEAYKYGRRIIVEAPQGYPVSRLESFLGIFPTMAYALAAFYSKRERPVSCIRQRIRALPLHRVVWCGSTRWCACGKAKFHFGHSEMRSRFACQQCGSHRGIVQRYAISDRPDRVWLHQACGQPFLDGLSAKARIAP
jgi:hypothetical protein